MSTQISRRRVVTGAAWAVPAVVVAAAAPALAASTSCPTQPSVSSAALGNTAIVTLSGLQSGIGQIVFTSVGGAGFTTVPGGIGLFQGQPAVTFTLTQTDTSVVSGTVTLGYTIVLTDGRRCTGYTSTFTFTKIVLPTPTLTTVPPASSTTT